MNNALLHEIAEMNTAIEVATNNLNSAKESLAQYLFCETAHFLMLANISHEIATFLNFVNDRLYQDDDNQDDDNQDDDNQDDDNQI